MRIPHLLSRFCFASSFKNCLYEEVSSKSSCLIRRRDSSTGVRWPSQKFQVYSRSTILYSPTAMMAKYENDANDAFTDGADLETSGVEGFSLERANIDDLSDDVWQDLEDGLPSELMVMKDLLGVNVFTYLLAAAILFFLGMNAALGPGWLGSAIGIQGTGDFTETSNALPETLDLGNKDYLL